MAITMSTPYPEMYKVIWEEYDRCEYWVNRKIDRAYRETYMLPAARRNDLKAKLPTIEYKGKSGNRWNNYVHLAVISGGNAGVSYDSVCYWDTYGSFGAFCPLRYDGKRYIGIFTGHFWQRLCERTGLKMHGINTCDEFFDTHRSQSIRILPLREGETRKQVVIHYNGGAAYGVMLDEEYGIIEMRTYLDEKQLAGTRLANHMEVKDNLCSEAAKRGYEKLMSLWNIYPGAPMFMLLDKISKNEREALLDMLMDNINKDPSIAKQFEDDYNDNLAKATAYIERHGYI